MDRLCHLSLSLILYRAFKITEMNSDKNKHSQIKHKFNWITVNVLPVHLAVYSNQHLIIIY